MTTINSTLNEVIEHSRLLDVDEDLAIQEYYKSYHQLKTQDLYKNNLAKAMEDSLLATKRWITAYSKKQDERHIDDI